MEWLRAMVVVNKLMKHRESDLGHSTGTTRGEARQSVTPPKSATVATTPEERNYYKVYVCCMVQ